MKEIDVLELEPASSLHIGSGDFDMFFGANGIFENGLNQPGVPGSSLAGVFIATLRDVVADIEKDPLFYRITGDDGKEKKPASLLWFRSWYSDKAIKNLRDRLRIEPATRAAADEAKFAQWEIAPHELKIKVVIGVEDRGLGIDDLGKIRHWIDAVAWSWKTEGVALGAFSAAGLGWCRLTENGLKRFEITRENHEVYLDTPINKLPDLESHWKSVMPKEEPNDQVRRYLVYDLLVEIPKDWGIEALLIKGGQHAFSLLKGNEVDMAFIHDGRCLFIPGSSVKGAFKAFIRRYRKDLLDFFGKTDKGSESAGSLLIEDLRLDGDPREFLLPVERHAEDELTRAVWGGGKFNEERLFAGRFKGRVRIPVKKEGEWTAVRGLLKQGFQHRLISLGAGGSYPAFSITETTNNRED